MQSTRIISVVSLKGGVGKTTSSVNIAGCLAEKGKKVLIIDLDPHSGATLHLGFKFNELENTIAEVFVNTCTNIEEAVYKTFHPNLFIAVSNNSLSQCEVELEGEIGRENILYNSFNEYIYQFDFVIIDAPPTSSLLLYNVLRASKEILIPFQTTFMGVTVLEELNNLINKAKRRINPEVEILGYFATMFNKRGKESALSYAEVKTKYKEKVFNTLIPLTTSLSQAARKGKTSIHDDKSSLGAKAYLSLVNEIF